MSARTLLWSDRHMSDRALRFASMRLAALFGANAPKNQVTLSYADFMEATDLKAKSVLITLPASLAFKDSLDSRAKSYQDRQSILANQADTISPLLEEPHTLLAQGDPNATSIIHCLTLREQTLDAIKAKAQSLFLTHIYLTAETDPATLFTTPITLAQERFTRGAWASGCAALLFSLWACGTVYARHLERDYNTMRIHEADLRALVLDRSENARKITAYDTLVDKGVSTFTVSARLNALQRLNSATPKTAWWYQVSFNGQDMTVSGTSENAAAILQALSERYPDRSVRFMRPLTNEADGTQTYAIRLAEDAS